MSTTTTNLMLSNVRTFLEVQGAFDECCPEVKAVIHEMLEVWKHPDSNEDEKERALLTIVEALFPALTIDFMSSEAKLRRSETAKARDAELDQQESVFAERLNAILKKKGITQERLGELTGIGQPAISNMLSRKCRPQRRTVIRFAEALEVDPSDLWPGISTT